MKSLVKFALCASVMAVMFADASYAQTASRRSNSGQTSSRSSSSSVSSSRSSSSSHVSNSSSHVSSSSRSSGSSHVSSSAPEHRHEPARIQPSGQRAASSAQRQSSEVHKQSPAPQRSGSTVQRQGAGVQRPASGPRPNATARPVNGSRPAADVRPSAGARPSAERHEIRPSYKPGGHEGPGHYDHHHRFGYINHAPAPFHMHSHSHHHYFGYRVRTLPVGYTHHIHHGIDYYFCDGVYYRMFDGVYVVCRPPYGYTFTTYTGTPTVVYVNNTTTTSSNMVQYLYDDGVFFYVNSRGEYEVIQAPLGAMVDTLPEDCNLVRIDGMDYYAVDSTLFKLVVLQGKPMFEVVDNNFYRIDS